MAPAARQAVVLAAEVVVTTLSSAGGDLASLWSAATTAAAAAAAVAAAAAAPNGAGGAAGRAGGMAGVAPASLGAPSFDALVIDEAAQALEPAALIPLQLLQPGAKVRGVRDAGRGGSRGQRNAMNAGLVHKPAYRRCRPCSCNLLPAHAPSSLPSQPQPDHRRWPPRASPCPSLLLPSFLLPTWSVHT
jgi:hypothetical protein